MSRRIGLTYRRLDKLGSYAQALERAGLDPVPLHPDEPHALDGLDGLVVSGGSDLNAQMYGQQNHPQNEAPDDPRDRMEAELLNQALDADLPVFCICRGMQLLNVIRHGDLVQHIESGTHKINPPDEHFIDIEPGTVLASILGSGPFSVNSRHHQAVGRLGESLVVSGRSRGDGIVEALEVPGRYFALAVQWHPEDRSSANPGDRKLFDAFAAAVNARPRTP